MLLNDWLIDIDLRLIRAFKCFHQQRRCSIYIFSIFTIRIVMTMLSRISLHNLLLVVVVVFILVLLLFIFVVLAISINVTSNTIVIVIIINIIIIHNISVSINNITQLQRH